MSIVNSIIEFLYALMLSRSYGSKNTNRGILIKIVTSLSKVNCLKTIATDKWAQ